MAFDINPLSFIGDLYSTGKMQKWVRLFAACSVSAFLGFWGGLGAVGGIVLASTHSLAIALASGFFSGCVLMAGSVAMTVQKQKMWTELGIAMPKQLQEILEQTDVGDRK